jgi:hypothetical protein
MNRIKTLKTSYETANIYLSITENQLTASQEIPRFLSS